MSEDIWERRYRDLERQIEYMMIGVAESLARVQPETESLEIRKLVQVNKREGSGADFYCVADGKNLEFRFRLISNRQVLSDSKFGRYNSYAASEELLKAADVCEVVVRSLESGEEKAKRRKVSSK